MFSFGADPDEIVNVDGGRPVSLRTAVHQRRSFGTAFRERGCEPPFLDLPELEILAQTPGFLPAEWRD